MSQPNQTNKLAVMQTAKPQFPEFEKFANSIKSQERAKFAYEMKNGLRSNRAKGDTTEDTVLKLLRKAQALILKHENTKAETVLKQAISLDGNDARLHSLLGEVLMKDAQRLMEALGSLMKAVKLEPRNGDHFGLIGTLLMRMKQFDEAIDYFEIAVKFDPTNHIALSRLMHTKAHRVRWDDFEKISTYLKPFKNKTVLSDPFAFLSLCDDAAFQKLRSISQVNSKLLNPVKAPNYSGSRLGGDKIRVGYFSNDFYNHATMHLMGGLLENHDRDKFEIYIYDYGSKLRDHEHERARRNANVFRDVRHKNTQEIVDLARQDGLDIAVDLKGFTENGRLDMFNSRVAPVQVAYLGYPGTTGLKSMDYMVADKITIPSHLRKHYTEKILYMPNCYQPNDERRFIAEVEDTRVSHKLPEHGFVFSSFNSPYKVTPREYDIWMKLLKEVPDSVLWFYVSDADLIDRLRKEAEARGVDGERIIPTGRMQPEYHLARLKHADLFLDTFNVNAHTTASDALWAGLPVVTKTGEQFAARVAGSILTAAGLEDLVTHSEKKYHDVALRVAQDPEYLADIRARLAASHSNSALFDTKSYTRDFEKLMERAFQNYVDGNTPRSLGISAA